MRNLELVKNYTAEAAIAPHRIVKFGAADGGVLQSAAAADAHIGVSLLGAAAGERLDVVRDGIAEVEYGAAVTRGDLLTADAQGRAVPAAPAAGVNARVIGIAEVSGVAGDIGAVAVEPGSHQG